MSLHIEPGVHILRWTALTPANCGDANGTAAVDRPVGVDVWHRLPYLPASSLKGVLAGRWGNVRADSRRTMLFGAPIEDGDQGQSTEGLVVFGDGDPLSFPVLLRDGRRAPVVVASTVYELIRLGLAPGEPVHVPRTEAVDTPVALELLPDLPVRPTPAQFGLSPELLAWLCGWAVGGAAGEECWILAAPAVARALWQLSVEERTLTALAADKTVLRGSLRQIELVPPGATFVSVTSHHGTPGEAAAADLGPTEPIQLGAWEGTGLGYFRAEVLSGEPALAGLTPQGNPVSNRTPSRRPTDDEIMRRTFEAVTAISSRSEASVARSAIFDLGPRLQRYGLPSTLGFCLARVSPSSRRDQPSRESRAYRWLLEQLLATAESEVGDPDLHARTVQAISTHARPWPELLATWLWLRRFAEVLLTRQSDG